MMSIIRNFTNNSEIHQTLQSQDGWGGTKKESMGRRIYNEDHTTFQTSLLCPECEAEIMNDKEEE
jgi:hypothetical protein